VTGKATKAPSSSPEKITPTLRRRVANLAPFLEQTFQHYHRPDFLGSDPLALAHEWTHPDDQELVALLAALLAYGQVGQAVLSTRRVLERLDHRPSAVVATESFEDLAGRMAGWRHRVTSGQAMALLLWLVGQSRRSGTADNSVDLHAVGDDIVDSNDCGRDRSAPPVRANAVDLLVAWRDSLTAPATQTSTTRAILESRDFRHLLPDPARGSACKRLMLFLRWMVRPADGVDLGLWHPGNSAEPRRATRPDSPTSDSPGRSQGEQYFRPGPDAVRGLRCGVVFHPADLLMPLDTHVLRVAINLGLLPDGASANLATARRLTALLALVDPGDPVRFDFALCRLGILQTCPTRERLSACEVCALQPVCRRHQRMVRGQRVVGPN
jgi:hypothetical protein